MGQARFAHQTRAILVNCKSYEGLFANSSYQKDLLKNVFYRCDVDIVHCSHDMKNCWLLNLETSIGETHVFRYDEKFSATEGNKVKLPQSVFLEIEHINDYFTPASVEWFLYDLKKFYLNCILGIDCFYEKNEQSEFIRILAKLFDQYCKTGSYCVSEDLFELFPYLRLLWLRKIEVLLKRYKFLHQQQSCDNPMLTLESKMKLVFKISGYEKWVRVCCDRVEINSDNSCLLIKYLYGDLGSMEKLKLCLSLEFEALYLNGYLPQRAAVWIVKSDQIIVKDIKIEDIQSDHLGEFTSKLHEIFSRKGLLIDFS